MSYGCRRGITIRNKLLEIDIPYRLERKWSVKINYNLGGWRFWTEDDNKKLLETLDKPIQEVQKILNRTYHSIVQQRRKLRKINNENS